jgi:hypothetical protein
MTYADTLPMAPVPLEAMMDRVLCAAIREGRNRFALLPLQDSAVKQAY